MCIFRSGLTVNCLHVVVGQDLGRVNNRRVYGRLAGGQKLIHARDCAEVFTYLIYLCIYVFIDCTYSALATAMEIHAVFPARVVRPVWQLPLWCCSLHLPPRCLPPSWSLRKNGRMTTRTIVMAFDLTVLYPFETSLHRLHCYSFYIASLVSKMSW